MGAGAIGCFVGGRLAAAGQRVRFIGRARIGDALRAEGLRLTDLESAERQLAASAIDWQDGLAATPAAVETPGLVLLCVKSAATAEAAGQLAALLPPGTALLCLQNGVDNAELAALAAPGLRVLPGMVPFNVAQRGPAWFHRGTSGRLAAQQDPALLPYLTQFAAAGLPLSLHQDLRPVLWAKLLLNLNNPVNALSGLPLRAQLLDAGWRRCTALLMDEALGVLQAAGLQPARLTPLPPAWIPHLMRLPTPLFRLIAAGMLRIDPNARSSMADDLALGRATEIDAICGAIVRLGARLGRPTPRNAAMVELMRQRRALPLAEVRQALQA